jgi:hypothetical protein
MQRIIALIASAAVFSLSSVPLADACGDKLAAIGGGIRFDRIYRAEHPGHLLVYLAPESRLKLANDELQIVSWLQRAGHEVKIIDSRAMLNEALAATTPTDLLLLDASDARALAGNAESRSKAPMLPVLYRPTADELAAARSSGACFAQASKRRQYQFVQLVDRIVANGRGGASNNCAVI